MGWFDIFKKKSDKEEHIKKINDTLRSSFSNVKKDIIHIHKGFSDHTTSIAQRFEHIEKRLEKLEINLNILQNTSKYTKIIEKSAPAIEKEEVTESEDNDDILNVLKGIPNAELKLFKALYELQDSLNAKQISYKSLASYLYPGKDYNSLRSTITQFVLRLYTEGLVDKQRLGKETYVRITPNGYNLLKKGKIKRMIKELEVKD